MDSINGSQKAVEHSQNAPWLQIPSRAVSVVEHPCLIKNIDKGIVSLGGPVKLSKGLRARLEPQPDADGHEALPNIISASLRPDDPLAKRLLSTPVATNNLLLKVTVPKRTGRKRKRGSSGPYLSDGDARGTAVPSPASKDQNSLADAATVYRSLRDNASRYAVSVAGVIDETHRFRNLPDLQYAASTNSTMLKIRDNLLPLSFAKLKDLNLNTAAGPDLSRDVGPSAEFIQLPVAYNYRFHQNTFVKYKNDSDDLAEINLHKSLAWSGYSIIKPNAESVPTGPKPTLPPEKTLSPYVQEIIDNIRDELEKRPIITRHFLYNTLGWDKRDRVRQAALYCGYFFETGPWREALITWGLDPRTDPKYRFYQTVSFLSYKKIGTARHFTHFDQHVRNLTQLDPQELRHEHIFDGAHVSRTGNLFQFCDVTDPLIQRILRTDDIRTSPAPTAQGWFHVGTWAKATVILKHKMNTILGGEKPDDAIYARILTWPELWDDKEFFAQYTKEFHDRQAIRERGVEHTVMRSVRYAAKNPRYAFEMLEASQGQSPSLQHQNDNEEEEEAEVEEDMSEVPERAEDILHEGEGVGTFSDEEVDEDDDDETDDDAELEEDGSLDEDMMDEDVDGEWEVDDISTTFGFGGFYDPER